MLRLSAFEWAVFFTRILTMGLSAAFAAALLHEVLPVWRTLPRSNRAWVLALLVYSVNTAVFLSLLIAQRPAIWPDSAIWGGHALFFILLHRALYLSGKGRVP